MLATNSPRSGRSPVRFSVDGMIPRLTHGKREETPNSNNDVLSVIIEFILGDNFYQRDDSSARQRAFYSSAESCQVK
jgi:hypothetical protein